jgi:hypothetical protein
MKVPHRLDWGKGIADVADIAGLPTCGAAGGNADCQVMSGKATSVSWSPHTRQI